MYGLEILQQCGKKNKTKIQIAEVTERKLVGEAFLPFSPPPILHWIKPTAINRSETYLLDTSKNNLVNSLKHPPMTSRDFFAKAYS